MISQTRQRFIMGGMVAAALFFIVLGAIYQDDNPLDEPSFVGGDAGPVATAPDAEGSGGSTGAAPADEQPQAPVGPIEEFLPRSGAASACREAVGVDLATGFGAKLTINGIEIEPEQMNVNLDEDGAITDVITASRSLGQYTFRPDDNCPNGRFIRPVDNVLEVCVYRIEDNQQSCAFRDRNVFDAA